MLQEVTRLRFFFFEPFNEGLNSTGNFNLVITVEPFSPPFFPEALKNGGADETRTRDLMRDRHAF
jgi:hypothetical protein